VALTGFEPVTISFRDCNVAATPQSHLEVKDGFPPP
jgi:hypothetical protein